MAWASPGRAATRCFRSSAVRRGRRSASIEFSRNAALYSNRAARPDVHAPAPLTSFPLSTWRKRLSSAMETRTQITFGSRFRTWSISRGHQASQKIPIGARRLVSYRLRPMSVLYFALGLIVLYVAVVAAMYVVQTWLLFPTALARIARVQLPSSTQHLEVRTPDGESLKGVRIPSVGEKTTQTTSTLLGFGGNAWNAKVTALTLHGIFPGHDVVACHYRGYAPSSGRSSARALLSDSLAIFDSLRQGQIETPIVAVGLSIGSGVAAYLAQQRPVAGLILVTPFDSLDALAQDLYWWVLYGR